MTYALIDHATLTAVQRLAGEVPTKSRDSVDLDIVALENLLEAILFFDEIVAIDDYVPAHRQDRAERFPFIRFLEPRELGLEIIESQADDRAAEIRPEIRGGEFANDDFRQLVELLQTHIVCTWDISSSIYFLTLKVLAKESSSEFHKYGNLAAAIFTELGEAKNTGRAPPRAVSLVDRYGNPIRDGYKVPDAQWGDGTTGGTTGAIPAFVAALTWLANRSIYYSLAGRHLQADVFLYPIRQAYQQYYLSATCGYGYDFPRQIVESFSRSLSEDTFAIQNAGLAAATRIDLPVFCAWLARETGDPATIVDLALEIRNEPAFVEARDQLRAVRNAFDQGDIAGANKAVAKIVADIDKASVAIRDTYGIATAQGLPMTRLVQIYNSAAAVANLPPLPEFDIKVPIPEFLRDLSAPGGFNAVYRNMTSDLATVWGLGEIRDILGARVQKDDRAITYNPKAEPPEYRNSHSPFKSPM